MEDFQFLSFGLYISELLSRQQVEDRSVKELLQQSTDSMMVWIKMIQKRASVSDSCQGVCLHI